MVLLASEDDSLKVVEFRAPRFVRSPVSSDIPHDNTQISWERIFHHDSYPQPHDGGHTVAISAFFLSTLQTSLKRKRLIKEMRESGAGTIVNIFVIFNSFAHISSHIGPSGSQQPSWLPKHCRSQGTFIEPWPEGSRDARKPDFWIARIGAGMLPLPRKFVCAFVLIVT